MNKDRWLRVRETLESALEKTPAKRASFLDAACAGDVSLRGEVDSLLDADVEDSFLEQTPVESAARVFDGAMGKEWFAHAAELVAADFDPDTVLLVRTTRSVYRIVVVQPAAGTIVIEGGNLREPMKGRLLLNGHVRYGHRMAMAIGRLEIVTAPVETIAVR